MDPPEPKITSSRRWTPMVVDFTIDAQLFGQEKMVIFIYSPPLSRWPHHSDTYPEPLIRDGRYLSCLPRELN